MQNNLVREISGLENNLHLDTLQLTNNQVNFRSIVQLQVASDDARCDGGYGLQIRRLENIDHLPKLTTLNLANNRFESYRTAALSRVPVGWVLPDRCRRIADVKVMRPMSPSHSEIAPFLFGDILYACACACIYVSM